jgi:hypothetical protein
MKSFRAFIEEAGDVGDGVPKVHAPVWHASKDEIVQMWTNLKPSPILMAPIPENQKGTRLHNDGLRITGSASFINSVLSRLKDLLNYEKSPGTRLDLEYRQIEQDTPNASPNYLCYIHVEQDLKKKLKAQTVDDAFDMDKPKKPPVIKTALPGA